MRRGKLVGPLPRQRILVTGAPRSATTFVGRVLSWPWSVDYIHEPFNPLCGLPSLDLNYIDLGGTQGELRERLYREFNALLHYEPMLRTGYFARDPVSRRFIKPLVGSRGPFYLRIGRLNPFSKTVVVKDPFAIMGIEALASEWGFQTVGLVRHPIAFAASINRLGWRPTEVLADLRQQPSVMDRLSPEDRTAVCDPPSNELLAAAVLWRVSSRELLRCTERDPSVLVMTHEEINFDPISSMRLLYDRFGLPWSPRTGRRVLRLTRGSNPLDSPKMRTQSFARDSASLVEHRLASIGEPDRSRIWAITAELAEQWYTPIGIARPMADPDVFRVPAIPDARRSGRTRSRSSPGRTSLATSRSRSAAVRQVAIVDTAIGGDVSNEIVFRTCLEMLEDMRSASRTRRVPGSNLGAKGRKIVRDSEAAIVCGSVFASPRWREGGWIPSVADALSSRSKYVLMGVGTNDSDREWSSATRWILRSCLSYQYLHAVRDSDTRDRLRSIGVSGAVVTGCPSTWALAEVTVRSTPGERAIVALNARYDDQEFVRRLVRAVGSVYREVLFFPQGPEDHRLVALIPQSWRVLAPSLNALDEVISASIDTDFIGSRVMAGVRALQSGVRSFIFDSEPGTKEICGVAGLPTLGRPTVEHLVEIVRRDHLITPSPPMQAIQEWLGQFLWVRSQREGDPPPLLQPPSAL